jgi:hypothetical protein
MPQNRPQPNEYASAYGKYVALVPEGELISSLETQLQEFQAVLGPLSDAQGDFCYEEAKWSIKEMMGHISDTERIFAYRLLRIARGDQTPLSGFEQDDYVKAGNFAQRKLGDLLEELSAVRKASIGLLRSLDDAAWLRRGTANQKEVSVTALAFILFGHAEHHRLILEERYLAALPRG